MKSLVKLVSLTFCILLLSNCKTEAQERERDNGIISGGAYISYDYFATPTSINVNIGDSTFHYNYISVDYYSDYQNSRKDNNLLTFCLRDTTIPRILDFEFYTEIMNPEVFFSEGKIWKIDSLYAGYRSIGGNLTELDDFFQAVFLWENILYEKKLLIGSQDEYSERKMLVNGKGILEIKDTLFTGYQTIYYPPQKIVFEF